MSEHKYAFINDYRVIKIEVVDDNDIAQVSAQYQWILDIEGMNPHISIGWVFDGSNFYEDIPPVTPRQFRQAMILSGIDISFIEVTMEMLPEPHKSLAKVEWEYSTLFERRRPIVIMMGQLMGWSETDIDNIWELAGSLK